jgi:hypothetical protein
MLICALLLCSLGGVDERRDSLFIDLSFKCKRDKAVEGLQKLTLVGFVRQERQ